MTADLPDWVQRLSDTFVPPTTPRSLAPTPPSYSNQNPASQHDTTHRTDVAQTTGNDDKPLRTGDKQQSAEQADIAPETVIDAIRDTMRQARETNASEEAVRAHQGRLRELATERQRKINAQDAEINAAARAAHQQYAALVDPYQRATVARAQEAAEQERRRREEHRDLVLRHQSGISE